MDENKHNLILHGALFQLAYHAHTNFAPYVGDIYKFTGLLLIIRNCKFYKGKKYKLQVQVHFLLLQVIRQRQSENKEIVCIFTCT